MPTPSTLDVALLFDTEDSFSPPEAGNDDSIRELAEIFAAEGLPGVFLFIGDRAELLAWRGRQDVIASLRPHEVGLHTRSAVHPTSPEYTAGKSWEAGLEECLRQEREGVQAIERSLGKPACAVSTHWLFAAPQSFRAAAILGLPYVYGFPAAPPLYSVSRYCGALVLPWYSPTEDDSPFLPYMEGFDDHCREPAAIEAHYRSLEERIDACLAAGHRFASLLVCHPQRLRNRDFIDQFLSPNGRTLPPEAFGRYGRPRRYTPEEVARNLEGIRAFARWVRRHPRLRAVTMAQVVRQYGGQPATLSRQELAAAARAIVAGPGEVRFHGRLSPGEVVVGLAESVAAAAEGGGLPEQVVRREVLGPTANPVRQPEVPALSLAELGGKARELLESVARSGHLPANLGPVGARLGLGHLYAGLAEAYAAADAAGGRVERAMEVRFRLAARYPALGVKIAQRFLEVAEGPNIDPDLSIDALYRHAKLQTWTLKGSEREEGAGTKSE